MESKTSVVTLKTLRLFAAALGLTTLAIHSAKAHPYASAVTNDNGTIRFILNESADNVGVSFDNGTATNNLGALNRGANSFSLAGHTNYSIYVSKVGSGAPSLISYDTNRYVNFWGPRGVTVNRSPKTANFGRTYVINASAGTQPITGTNGGPWGTRVVTRGVYALNPDQTDAVGQGDSAKTYGMTLSVSTTYSPFRASVGPDDMLYVGDGGGAYLAAGNLTNGVWMVKPDLSSGTNLLPLYSSPQVAGGVVGTPIVSGSYANGDLVLYALQWDLPPYQEVWQYNIGGGPLPFSSTPTMICNAGIASVQGVFADMAIGPDGKIYTLEYRATPASGSVPIYVFDPSGTPLWNSWDNYGATTGDPYALNRAIAISGDGKMMATVVGTTGNFTITQLTNGIPDPATFTLVTTGFGATAYGIAFDAANNVYLTTSGLALLRVYSLGMTTMAITRNDATGTNGTFQLVSPSTTVSVTASTNILTEAGATAATFTITRTNANSDYSSPLPVSLTFSGSATFGADYITSATNSITIAAGQTFANVTITTVDDSIPELTETATLNLGGGGAYSTAVPRTATVAIVDNETPQFRISSLSTNIFEGNLNDYAQLTLTRYGDTNQQVVLDFNNFLFGGTAVSNVDYYLTNLPFTVDFGVISPAIKLIYPLKHSTAVGSLSILLTNVAGSGFTVSNNTAATTITLEAVPPEVVLLYENFENPNCDTNWNVFFATANNSVNPYDATVIFNYDYSFAQGNIGVGLLPALPPAPHSLSNDTHGVFMTVNKNDGTLAGAALNAYPILTNFASTLTMFTNNYAVRFDMYLNENTISSTTEYGLFGINHSGTKTNWFRNSGTGVDVGTLYDGLWYDVETDGSALGDYALYSSPTVTNTSGIIGPTSLASRNASTLTQVFKYPPYTPGAGSGGSPGNQAGYGSPSWAAVEISQIGNVITWKINNTVIFSYTNATAYTNGNIMLGYEDAYDSIGNGSAGAGEAAVVYDNVRVVRISPPTLLAGPSNIVAAVGTTTNFSVVVSTTTGVTNYQWYTNGVAIAGATSSKLTLAPVSKTSFGSYSVQVNDGAYSTLSANVTLMPPVPVINTQPVNRAAVVGSSPSFSVTATTYSGTTNYQWTYYGTNIPSATGASYTRTNVQLVSFGGPYTVRVNDGWNSSLTSAPPVTLTVAVSPLITVPGLVTGGFRLSIGSEFGPSYVVDYKGALTNGNWTPLSTNAGTGGIINITNTASGSQGFYRVRLQ